MYDTRKSQVSVESCPVNCIHWVETEELPVLEFLIQPQPKDGYGVFGGGWERPANVFTAAKSFNKQLKRKSTIRHDQSPGRNYYFMCNDIATCWICLLTKMIVASLM